MTEPQLRILVNGTEIQTQDLQLLGYVAAMADDRVLSELIRPRPISLEPFGVSFGVYKAILPYARTLATGEASTIATPQATGTVTASGTGVVLVRPFRAIIGTRTASNVSVPPATPIADGSAVQNWHEIRSQIVVGTYTPGPFGTIAPADLQVAESIVIPSNFTGNPRWDLIYARVTLDQVAGSLHISKVKDPNSSVVGLAPSISLATQAVQILSIQGSPNATPTVPPIPSDVPGVSYNIPLAEVAVPSGAADFLPGNIRDVAPIAKLSPAATGGIAARPANGNNDGAGTYRSVTAFDWVPTGPTVTRPSLFLPPSMVGEEVVYVQIDATGGTPSHANGSIVDNSIDWRNRFFTVSLQLAKVGGGTNAGPFGSDPSATVNVPSIPGSANFTTFSLGGNSMTTDAAIGLGLYTVAFMTNASSGGIVAGGQAIGLYIDSTGVLKAYINGAPAVRLWARIQASAQIF